MKKDIVMIFMLLSFNLTALSQSKGGIDKEKIEQEIMRVEKQFESDLRKEGVAAAFYKYAAVNAIIKRENDTLIKGSLAIKHYYSNSMYEGAIAEWTPDFIDLSDDGTMAYTYGKYKWDMIGTNGKHTIFTGVFHTVWKKMNDASWKYVWD